MKTTNKKAVVRKAAVRKPATAPARTQRAREVCQHPHDESVTCKECGTVASRLELMDRGGICNNCGTPTE